MSWLSRIFGNPKKELETLTVYKAEPKNRKKSTRLTNRDKVLVKLHHKDGMSIDEICRCYDISAATCYKIIRED